MQPSLQGLSPNDHRLIDEAIRRLEQAQAEAADRREALTEVMAEQVRRGRRDMFTLVRTGWRTLDGR